MTVDIIASKGSENFAQDEIGKCQRCFGLDSEDFDLSGGSCQLTCLPVPERETAPIRDARPGRRAPIADLASAEAPAISSTH